jgi:hypothetical protein
MQAPSYAETKPAPKRDPSRPIRTLSNSDQLRLMTKLTDINHRICRAEARRKLAEDLVLTLTTQRTETERLISDLHKQSCS